MGSKRFLSVIFFSGVCASLLVHLLFAQGQTANGESKDQSNTNSDVQAIYHTESRLRRESVSIIMKNGGRWSIGQSVDEKIFAKSNVVIKTDIFNVPFGPINGYVDANVKIGWNNRKKVLYVEAVSTEVKTSDGLRIGATKEDVVNILGIPFMEKSNIYRYQNTEFEVIGVLFIFDKKNIVERIIMFSYV
jgi:hypothetical protein